MYGKIFAKAADTCSDSAHRRNGRLARLLLIFFHLQSLLFSPLLFPMRVTISVLPVSLSLLHIPRSRLPQLSHSIIRQILQPDPVFLSITSNEIELSIFAEAHALQHFEPIARRDRQRSRSRSHSTDFEPIQISCEKWRVLQIDSHSDQLGQVNSFLPLTGSDILLADSSGARVNELSAPLAAAGISILYQSSYMSDFIFVSSSFPDITHVSNLIKTLR